MKDDNPVARLVLLKQKRAGGHFHIARVGADRQNRSRCRLCLSPTCGSSAENSYEKAVT